MVPKFSALSRRQKTLRVNIPYRGSHGPRHLLINSTGIKIKGESEQNAHKRGSTPTEPLIIIILALRRPTLYFKNIRSAIIDHEKITLNICSNYVIGLEFVEQVFF